MDIKQLKTNLHTARLNVIAATKMLEAGRSYLESQIEKAKAEFADNYDEQLRIEETALIDLATAEHELRTALIENYKLTGEKTFDKECGVAVTTKYEYKPEDAVNWAKINAPVLIVESVDDKAFKKMPMIADLDFVTVTETPVAKLATNFETFA